MLGSALALLASVALALASAGQAAAEAPYAWSGTMSVSTSHAGPESNGSATFSGPVIAGEFGVSYFEPTMQAYREASQSGWCSSTSDLAGVDTPDAQIPIFVEWGRPEPGGGTAVPRMVPHDSVEFAFPRHSVQCLAFDGGELKQYEDSRDGIYRMSDALYCTGDPYTPPADLPIAAPFFLPPPLPPRVVQGDGSLRFTGAVTLACDPFAGESSRSVTMTVDLTGTPVQALPDEQVGRQRLEVVAHGTQYGSVVGTDDAIACGQGAARCAAELVTNSRIRLAALASTAGRHIMWLGCDQVVGQSCLVDMHSSRTVHAWFGYDFVGQWEPPPDGLFDPARKAEIAGNGADAATNGAVGCGLSAALIGTAGGSSVIVAGTAGAATRFGALAEKAFEETVGNCVTGIAGTIFNGVLLKIDPPDPQWDRASLPERFPVRRVSRCRLPRGCPAFVKARTAYVAADARVLELQESIAVAANRYGNAVNRRAPQVQALHQATMRAASGQLAEDYDRRSAASAALATALQAAGLRRITIPRRVVARAQRAQASRRKMPKATVARLLRKHLIERADEVAPTLKALTPKKAKSIDVLRLLRRPVRTTQLRAAAAALTLADVARLTESVPRDTGVPQPVADRLAAQVALALRCEPDASAALRDLASLAQTIDGLNSEGRLILASAATQVAGHDLSRDPTCRS